MDHAMEWSYPPADMKPDPNKPVKLIERKGVGLILQFYDVAGRLHELPVSLVMFPQELQELREQLPLKDLWPELSVRNIDVPLTVLARLVRFGRDVSPAWIAGAQISAPAAGTPLVSVTVSPGKQGYIYGFHIVATEANSFRLTWTSNGAAYSILIPFPSAGLLRLTDFIAVNEGLPADGGTTISIANVNAGSAGSTYQAMLLYAEV